MIPLPVSMHTGQIIMLTKFFTEIDFEFYDFSGPTPVLSGNAIFSDGYAVA